MIILKLFGLLVLFFLLGLVIDFFEDNKLVLAIIERLVDVSILLTGLYICNLML